MPDGTPYEEKSRRIQLLIDLQQEITTDICRQQIGKIERVLVEGASTRDPGFICGKTDRGHMVNFPGNLTAGQMAEVRILSAGKSTLRGELI